MRQFVCLSFVKFEVVVRMHHFAIDERDVVGPPPPPHLLGYVMM